MERTLAAEQLGGVLVGAQHNFSWLTAGGSNGIDLRREVGAGARVPLAGRAVAVRLF